MNKWLSLALVLVTACVVGSADEDDDSDTDVAEEQVDAPDIIAASRPYSPKGDPSPSSDFNKNGKHNDQCVHLKGVAQLRYADGTPTGYVLDPLKLKFNPERRPVDDSSGNPCPDGSVQLDVQEHLVTGGQRLLFHRGGFPYSPAGDVKYGHLLSTDLTSVPSAKKTQGNGIECLASQNPATKGDFRIDPKTIPSVLSFRKTAYSACVAKAKAKGDPLSVCTNGYESYGDPGYDQGNFATADRHHYTYLLWNFTNVAGGGVVRADLPPDQAFHRCNVKTIKQIAYTDDGKKEIGWVKAVYGKVSVGGNWLYGWIVHSHHCNTGVAGCPAGTVLHVKPL
jgi:hypothetical protein